MSLSEPGRYEVYLGNGVMAIDAAQIATDAGLADRLWYKRLSGLKRVLAASSSLYTSRIAGR